MIRDRYPVRPATLSDADGIARLITALGYPCTTEEMRERLEPMTAEAGHTTLVATHEGRIVGMIGVFVGRVYEEPGPVGRILALSIDEAFRRAGLGSSLLAAAEALLDQRGISVALVNCGRERHGAHAFYEGAGYVRKGFSYRKRL